MTFSFLSLDLVVVLPPCRGNVHNFLRGQIGVALRQGCRCKDPKHCERICDYGRIFDPPRDPHAPSGLRDPLRPFVLRAENPERFRVHVFDVRTGIAERLVLALNPMSFAINKVSVDLAPQPIAMENLEVRFLTPIDLRSEVPAFATFFARARDRVSTLRAIYGEGPLDVDHRALGDLARAVELVDCDFVPHLERRRSRATGQVHSIGGYTGHANYRGDFSLFYPILNAARFTGVGRKTVWGNGQFSLRFF